MRSSLYALVDAMTRVIRFPEPIVEFGAQRVPEQAHLPSIRGCFPGQQFVGTDITLGSHVDEVQDLHALTYPNESIGTALLFDTIEHVRKPWTALSEVRRCLKPGGVVVMTSVFFFPIHDYGGDYWRFTDAAMESLLDAFDLVFAGTAGSSLLPHTAIGVAARSPFDQEEWNRLSRAVEQWLQHDSATWKERMMMIAPAAVTVAGYQAYQKLGKLRARIPASRRRDNAETSSPAGSVVDKKDV